MQDEITHTNIVLLPRQNGATWLYSWIRRIAKATQQKFWLVLLVMVLALAGTFIVTETTLPLYRATATFVFSGSNALPATTGYLDALDAYAFEERVRNTLHVLQSDEIAADLLAYPEIKAILAVEHNNLPASGTVRLQNAIAITYSNARRSFDVAVLDHDPAFTQAVANYLVTAYNHRLSLKNQMSRDQIRGLERAFNGFRERTLAAEMKAAFPGSLGPQLSDDKTSVSNAKRARLSDNIKVINADIAGLEKEIQALKNLLRAPANADFSEVTNKAVKTAYQNIVLGKLNLQSLLKNYQLPEDEKKKLQADIALQTVRFDQNIKGFITTNQKRLSKLTDRKTTITALMQLKTDFAAESQALGDMLNQTMREDFPVFAPLQLLTVTHAASLPDKPVSPDKLRNILWALVCGFALGAFLAAFAGFHDEKIDSSDEVEKYFRVPVLGLIPHFKR